MYFEGTRLHPLNKRQRKYQCNDFVQNINENHAFEWGKIQPVTEIRATIPAEFLIDFERGLTF